MLHTERRATETSNQVPHPQMPRLLLLLCLSLTACTVGIARREGVLPAVTEEAAVPTATCSERVAVGTAGQRRHQNQSAPAAFAHPARLRRILYATTSAVPIMPLPS